MRGTAGTERAVCTGRSPQRGPADAARNRYGWHGRRYLFAPTLPPRNLFPLTPVVEAPYTTHGFGSFRLAFLRRRGNAYYLVHNVRRGGKVKQLHLACLGDRPRLTDHVIRRIRRNHPLLELDWIRLRARINNHIYRLVTDSDHLRRVARHLHKINLELADLTLHRVGVGSDAVAELVALLRLLRATVEIKLRQFDRAPLAARSRRTLR